MVQCLYTYEGAIKMKKYFELIRIKHYLKNGLVFLPLIFSGKMFESNLFFSSLFAFLSFCAISSVVYIINDLKDVNSDRLHVVKKNRPLAAGKISVRSAKIMGIVFLIMAVGFHLITTKGEIDYSGLFILGYLILNIGYSYGLKNVPLLDIVILVAGFLIRVLYGGVIIDVAISNWLYLTVISTAFYLVLSKRRNEINNDMKSKKVLKYYNKDYLDKNMYVCLAVAIVFYALWTVDPIIVSKTNNLLIWTVPLIIIIFMKYNLNVGSDGYSDPVEIVFSDKVLMFLIIIYIGIVSVILYIM